MGQVYPILFDQFRHPLPAKAAGGVDVVEGIARFLFQNEQVCHDLVHVLGPQASESGKHHEFIRQAQLLPGFLFVIVDKALLYRHAHHFDFLGVIIMAHTFLKGYQHPAGPFGDHLGGHTGNGVGLMDTGGNAHFATGVKGREAGVAAGADDHIGLKLPEDSFALLYRLQHAVDGMDVLLETGKILFPAQTGAGQGFQFKARLGYQFFFHMAYGPDKQHPAVRVTPPHFVGNGNSGVDMSGGTAAGKYQIQNSFLLMVRLFPERDIFSTIPISPRFTARAVPP